MPSDLPEQVGSLSQGAGLPDGVGKVDTLPGLYRKPIELQDRVSLTESRLMSRTAYEQ